jgi:hypothetical protein
MGLTTTVLNPGAGGASVVTDQQVSGAQMPVSELAFSASGGDSAVATTANPFPTNTPDVKTTGGILGALNAALTITHPGLSTVGFQLNGGNLSGTLLVEYSIDGGTTWNSCNLLLNSNDASQATIAVNSSIVDFTALIPEGVGMTRVRVSSYFSGASSGTIRASNTKGHSPQIVNGQTASGASPVNGANPVLVSGADLNGVTRTVRTDTSGRPTVVGPAAVGVAPVGPPVLMGGSDGTFVRNLLTDTTGATIAVGTAAAGTAPIGAPVLVGGNDGTNVQTIGMDTAARQKIVGAVPNNFIAAGNPLLTGGANVQAGAVINTRVSADGTPTIDNPTLLAQDFFEGANLNTWLWTASATTMVNAQSHGTLTMNSGATTASGTDSIITTNPQFPLTKKASLQCVFRVSSAQTTNAVAEFGFGAPSGVTAIVNDGAFFRIDTGNQIFAVVSWNGTETVSAALGTISTTGYFTYSIWIRDGAAYFAVENQDGSFEATKIQTIPFTQSDIFSVSHLPAFGRVYNSGAAGTAPTLKISSFCAWQYDWNTTKSFAEQMAGTGRSSNVNPTTFAQTAQLAAGAAPGTVTPAATTSAYATLGGEFVCNGTASSENLLGVFGFQVPSPYGLYVTIISLPQPFITSALGAVVHIQEWCLMVASSGNPSTATGQRYTLGMFSAAASAAAGTVLNGQPLQLRLTTPIFIPAGQFLLVLVKIISGSAAGIYRGSILVNGYYQ